MWHWLEHVTGIDTQQSPFYDFWSGIATQGTIIIACFTAIRHKNCQKKWCWRLGHPHPETHLPYCKKHRGGV